MTRDVTYQGRVYAMANAIVYELRADGKFAGTNALMDGQSTETRVTLTGYYTVSAKGNTMYQTTGGGWIDLKDGWQYVGTAAIMQHSDTQAQALVNKIINNNIAILRNNLLCARFAHKLTREQQAEVRELQSRLQARNSALQAEGLTHDIRNGYPEEYAELSPYMDRLMNGEIAPVGIATWAVIVIVIVAVIIAGMGTAAYFAYKALADESERDVKFSKDLTATLVSKLTEEEYQQLLDETKGLLTKAKIKQAIGSYGNVLKIAAFAIAGFSLYKLIKSRL